MRPILLLLGLLLLLGIPAVAQDEGGEFRAIEYTLELWDAEGRPYALPANTGMLLVRLPAQEALAERTEIRSGDVVFPVDGEALPFAVEGQTARVAFLAFRDPAQPPLQYEIQFAYNEGLGDPQAALQTSPFPMEVASPAEGEEAPTRFSLDTNENLHTMPEKVGLGAFLVVGVLAAWLAAGRVLFRGLLMGGKAGIGSALTLSNLAFLALLLLLAAGGAWAWFNPGVNGPHVQYFGYVSAAAVFAVAALLVGLFGKAIDAR